ncbi:ABC transporter solute-binding protein [Desulfocucumis palustris]|uniref:ABC transporter solute-binding protein n=1 Tax=Desulfocucumis palustris TaxID=1898651 RepID=A0A2L2XMK3_9FIRM|nr:ABC transporter substrate-binding protein [Desulfocucumis palustris]GBF35181.1 ABC transporter solute-binding protein [Desulfocucumis palustris]
MIKRLNSTSLAGLFLVIVIVFVTGLAGCANKQGETPADNSPDKTRAFVDDAGRTSTIPGEINKVFSTSPVGTIMVYTLDPDKLIGWNYDLKPGDANFILPQYRSLPNLGGWYAKSTCNVEEILKIHPDLILSMGAVDQTSASQADKIQNQTGIPVVTIKTDLDKMDKAYEILGELLDEKSRAAELAAYCRQTVSEAAGKAAQIPADKRVRVYYAEGPKGLQTDPSGSPHTQVLDLVGGINVADIPPQRGVGGMGMSDVSMEQVLSWNPDVILTRPEEQGGAYNAILSDPKWRELKAVKNNRIYLINDYPFCWFDRPPSSNRIIGIKWLGKMLYPDVYQYDLAAEVKKFYSMFYHYDLSDQEADKLLTPPGGK